MAKKKQAKTKMIQQDGTANARMKVVLQGMDKKYGKGAITFGNATGVTKLPYQIPSGSVGLDLALGPMFRHPNGKWQTGFGPGRIIEVFGPESTGKTTLMLLLIANAQKMGGKCAFLDAEHNLDPNYAFKLGVDMDNLLISQPDNGEQTMQMAEDLLRSKLFSVVCVDSVAALITKAEMEGEIGDSNMGGQARLMSQSLRKFTNMMGQGVTTNLYFSNQIREKIGVMFGNPETQPGGRALKFYASYRLDVRRKENIYNGSGDDKIQVGHKMKVQVIKNKVAAPFRRAIFDLIYGHGIDVHAELLDLCADTGLIDKSGAYYVVNGNNIGQGRENATQALKDNPAWASYLYDQLLTKNLALQGLTPELEPLPGFVPIPRPDKQLEFVGGVNPFAEEGDGPSAEELAEQEENPEGEEEESSDGGPEVEGDE